MYVREIERDGRRGEKNREDVEQILSSHTFVFSRTVFVPADLGDSNDINFLCSSGNVQAL